MYKHPTYPHVSAKVIAASENPYNGSLIATLELAYPRFIHGELKTHRMFSTNSMSSRAVPVKKMLAQVWSNPVEPIHWGANNPGMQSKSELAGWRLWAGRKLWRGAAKSAVLFVWALDKLGAHKQWANRILEPWQLMRTLVTATEWENFFVLRDHPDAQPEFQALSRLMQDALADADYVPRLWHLPYVLPEEYEQFTVTQLAALSAARCARVSYLTHGGKAPSYAADLKLFNLLVESKPEHASPVEHQAVATGGAFYNLRNWVSQRWLRDHGMMQGWQMVQGTEQGVKHV